MLRISGLNKRFEIPGGYIGAVRDLDLEVADGEFIVLLGPSGCGKSTLLRCVAGLERPEQGTIHLGDRLLSAADRRVFVEPEDRDIAMVFQSYAIWPHMTVFENVAFPLTDGKERRRNAGEVAERVRQALVLVQLDSFERHSAATLSGGQQQRVALARALVREPKLLLMDEPLSNLDARLRDSMRTELKRLTLALGVTTLYVTHDQIEALSMGDRICVMRDGRILQQGPPEDVYSHPVDVFVAGFVGAMNFVPGTVCGPRTVSTPLGSLACPLDDDYHLGDTVTLAIRPEHVEVADDASGDNVVAGRLVTRLFIGDAAMWSVEADELTLEAKVPGAARAPVGDRVYLRLRPERWQVFRTTPAPGARSDLQSVPTG